MSMRSLGWSASLSPLLFLLLPGCDVPPPPPPPPPLSISFHAPSQRNLGSCESRWLDPMTDSVRVYIETSAGTDSLDVPAGAPVARTYRVPRPATVRVWSMRLPHSRTSCDTTIMVP